MYTRTTPSKFEHLVSHLLSYVTDPGPIIKSYTVNAWLRMSGKPPAWARNPCVELIALLLEPCTLIESRTNCLNCRHGRKLYSNKPPSRLQVLREGGTHQGCRPLPSELFPICVLPKKKSFLLSTFATQRLRTALLLRSESELLSCRSSLFPFPSDARRLLSTVSSLPRGFIRLNTLSALLLHFKRTACRYLLCWGYSGHLCGVLTE